MRRVVIRPRALSSDDEGLADFVSMADVRADAKRGSEKLLKAILKAHQPRVTIRRKRPYGPYGSWTSRKEKFAEIDRLQAVVADYFEIPAETMKGYRGPHELASKRQIAMYLARKTVRSSFPDIARCFGGKDHSTVIHACQVVEANPAFATDVSKLLAKLRAEAKLPSPLA